VEISSFADSLNAGSRCTVIFGPRSKFTCLGNIADKNIVAYGNKRRGIAEDGRKDETGRRRGSQKMGRSVQTVDRQRLDTQSGLGAGGARDRHP
jgi:hypothetical protein